MPRRARIAGRSASEAWSRGRRSSVMRSMSWLGPARPPGPGPSLAGVVYGVPPVRGSRMSPGVEPRPPLPDPFLRCSVRGCARVLRAAGGALRCASGHAFDVARAGYVNLLQPQDKRSTQPGDARAAVQARRRFLRSGALAGLRDAIASMADGASVGRFLDVGCGEGSFTAELARAWHASGVGLDLSSEACDAAARAHGSCSFVVANADRELPFVDASFGRILSITARRNAPEMARVLAPDGDAILVVAGADDLLELREVL